MLAGLCGALPAQPLGTPSTRDLPLRERSELAEFTRSPGRGRLASRWPLGCCP
jgi:hypothetical protein